ncbi:efflux transporter outer membrane subunit, partial [Pararobbsia alpina]|uniref:efflux transporter outer membrane subunit n=1 Tax=Pararobbsia alpina TaxID=621374 RepID=UPI001FEBAA5C
MKRKPLALAMDGIRLAPGPVLAGLLLALCLGGCAVGPDFKAPSPPTDRDYVQQPVSTSSGETEQHVVMGGNLRADWWKLLQSPELDRVVEQALANNWSIDAARANLAKAGEGVAVARGGLYPQVDAVAGAGREKYGASFLGPEAFTFPVFSSYTGGAVVSYDLDVFGAERRQIEFAASDADVQKEVVNAAHLSVAGNTVLEALQIASIRAQIEVAQSVIASDQQNLELVQAAYKTGVATQMDVTTAQSQLDSDRTMLPPLHQQLDVAQDALAILVGQSPAAWTAPDFKLATLTLPADIPLVVPSDLVRARPDIRAAQARLHAANAAVGMATADMYPRFTLSAAVAEQGLISGPSGAAWSLIGGLTAPVFHGGALSAHRRQMQDAYQATLAEYQQTVLTAFGQVADNLHGLSNSADEVRTEQQALDSANAALRLTRLGYRVGNAGIVQVLDAQRLQQLAELRLVQARTTRYVQTVGLFLATGGGLADVMSPSPGSQTGETN